MDSEPVVSDGDPLAPLVEEFIARLRRGERPAVADFIARCPEHAGRIAELLPALELMERLKPGADTGSFTAGGGRVGAAAGGTGPRRLGDYVILRELGRGGMGVVYEVVQESLGRHVALKVLLGHTHTGPAQRERFRLEARSVARLHHTNIVPVFAVGEHDGVPFYAMQYIAGHSLEAVLDDLRRLRGGAAAAQPPGPTAGSDGGSLAVARSLLAGLDGSGPEPTTSLARTTVTAGGDEAVVPDGAVPGRGASSLSGVGAGGFYRAAARVGLQVAEALAHAHDHGVLHRDIKPSNLLLEADGRAWVTDFGLAKLAGADGPTRTGDIVGTLRYMAPERLRGDSDPRSDVYGLGATLYELLTLRPAFDEGDRARLIDRVVHDDPPPPRALDPRIPRDLETIVLKAIAKDPAGRYASARALAEDLGRFLDDRTVLARRSRPSERLWRWCRREPALAALATALAATLVVGFLGVATQWRRAEGHLREVLHQRALLEADFRREVAANRALDEARRRAQERFNGAMKALRKFEDVTKDAALLREARLQGLRAALLQTALAFYRELQASLEEDASPGARSQLADAYTRVGHVTWDLGLQEEGLAAYRRSLALVEQLAAADPTDRNAQASLGRAHAWVGFAFRTMGRPADALRSYEQARGIQEPLARDDSANPRRQEVLSWTLSQLGVIHLELGRTAESISLCRRAVAIHEGLVGRDPGNAVRRSDFAWCWRYLCLALASSGDVDEALRLAGQAAAVHEELVRANPGDVEFRWRLARCLDAIGRIRTLSGRPAEATVPLERAAGLYEALANDYPVQYAVDVARNRLYLASQRALSDRPEEAWVCLRGAEEVLSQSPNVRPGLVFYDMACGDSLWSVAGQDGAIAPSEREARARRSVAALRRAVLHGHRDLGRIRRDPVLDPLRPRRDFQELLMDLSFPADPFRQ
jgi:serine/threonine protein kinase